MHHTELAARRRRLGLTQAELAARLEIPVNTLARWERGDLAIQHPKVLRLALDTIDLEVTQHPPAERERRTKDQMQEEVEP